MKPYKQTEEHRKKNSEGLKRHYLTHTIWNKGLTKDTDERMARQAQGVRRTWENGRVPVKKRIPLGKSDELKYWELLKPEIEQLYLVEKFSMTEIGKMLNISSPHYVRDVLKIPKRSNSDIHIAENDRRRKNGTPHPLHKASYIGKNGTTYLHEPWKKWEPEYRIIWERTHGQKLPKGHPVHHLNGIHTDNRPENLFATTTSNHAREGALLLSALRKRIRELECKNTILEERLSALSSTISV